MHNRVLERNIHRDGSPIADYVPAIELLVGRGFQVLLAGDQTLERDHMDSFGGMVAFVGTYEEPVNDFIPIVIYGKAIKAVGNWGGMMRPAYDWMRDGTIRTDELITHQYPLADINEAFEMQLTRNESIKVIVHP